MAGRCLLYYITDRTTLAADERTRTRRLLDKVSEAADAGIDYIQLREKDLATRQLEALACEASRVLDELRPDNLGLRTRILINSRTDVALASGAAGVHLRSDDVSPKEVTAIWTKSGAKGGARVSTNRPLLGVSCHSPEDVQRAADEGATFAVFGPVFEKKDAPTSAPAGLSLLREACKAKIPVLALGGITLNNVKQCLKAGASGIAAIRLFQEGDIGKTVRTIRSIS